MHGGQSTVISRTHILHIRGQIFERYVTSMQAPNSKVNDRLMSSVMYPVSHLWLDFPNEFDRLDKLEINSFVNLSRCDLHFSWCLNNII